MKHTGCDEGEGTIFSYKLDFLVTWVREIAFTRDCGEEAQIKHEVTLRGPLLLQ